tara:strand:- start:1786 stop:2367 length:582 start_codon:yes stop_codon:yes gene_type:complete
MKSTMKIIQISMILFFSFANYGFSSELTDKQRQEIANLSDDIFNAPNFSLYSVNDSLYTLDSLKGNVILLNFWATWCGPCRMEIPDFNELYLENKDDGFIILGISTSDTKEILKNFLKSYKVEYPILYGSPTEVNKVSNDYGGIMALPTSVLIGRDAQIIRIYPGAILKDYSKDMYSAFIYDLKIALKEEIKN